MKIETIELDRLIPYARNSRTHSDEQVAQVAASIREFGFTNPVLIDSQYGIIAGHGRVMAARKLGMEEVPCIMLGHLTETQKRAYIIADNKLALNSGWDNEMLGLELSDLLASDFDIDLIGFDADDIGDLITDEAPGEQEPNKDKSAFQQRAFTLHEEQVEEVEAAISRAKQIGHGESPISDNGDGNALTFICQSFNRSNS